MKPGKRSITAVILLSICVVIHVLSRDEGWVEHLYSRSFFPGISRFFRQITGVFPFSLGDILYGVVAAWLLVKCGRALAFVWKGKHTTMLRQKAVQSLLKLIIICSILYIVFNIFWGMNYNREGIAAQLELKIEKYSTAELKEMNALLVTKINASKRSLLASPAAYPSNKELFRKVSDAYRQIAVQYPYLAYQPASLKSSLWGWVGNYTGFTGYYNPFSGEAQVNTTVPKFSQPFTACHEVAHQLGYAKEMEANFVGYLAAAASKDTLFHYSVYLDLFNYANNNLYWIDSSSAKSYRTALLPEVVADVKEWAAFSRAHKNPVGPVVRWLYGKYLQGNKQPQGLFSYDEVTAFLIAYHKKFGRI